MSPVWNTRLSDFAGVFTKRSSEFEFALTIHTALGVNTANRLLNEMLTRTRQADARIETMMKVFERFERSASSHELELEKLIEEQGGKEACQQNPKLLQAAAELEQHKLGARVPDGDQWGVSGGATRINVEEIREDLALDPTAAMEKNKTVFSRKLDMQKRQIEELSKTVYRTGDRIIEELTKVTLQGPYDKIIDRNVYEVWKLMVDPAWQVACLRGLRILQGWRGSVKCRHFVMALCDYFQEKWDSQDHHTDQWALAHINVLRLQSISEAFDDDASGFITLVEVNSFTSSRPQNWSLPHWIAYWAVGWHWTMFEYSNKISELFDKIFAITMRILPENQTTVGKYLGEVYIEVWELCTAVHRPPTSSMLQARFQDYVKDEEDRLRKNLETVRYDVDAMATLILITGKGRIEKFVLPLLYLILQRHLEILQISRKDVIHPDELWDASKTVGFVLQAVRERRELLTELFVQQRLDIMDQFTRFAHGLFSTVFCGSERDDEKKNVEYEYKDDLEDRNIKPEDILNYPINPELRDFSAYDYEADKESQIPIDTSSPLKAIIGRWNGYLYMEDSKTPTLPISEMMSMSFVPCTTADGLDLRFMATDRNSLGEFSMEGECSWGSSRNTVIITLKLTFAPQAGLETQYWTGELNTFTETIIGESTPGPHYSHKTRPIHFIFKHTAPEYMCFRPAPAIFKANKASALWTFARSAVLQQVRRKLWTWSFFRDRRDTRNVFLEYEIHATAFGRPLNSDEKRKFRQARQLLNTADGRFLRSLSRHLIRQSTVHRISCGICYGSIGGARIVCLSCISAFKFGPVTGSFNICESPHCISQLFHMGGSYKRQGHNLLKLRRFVLDVKQIPGMKRMAQAALSRLVRQSKTTAAVDFLGDHRNLWDSSSAPDSKLKSDSDRVVQSQSDEDEADLSKPRCAVCAQLVQTPYWYCVQCKELTFICDDCDSKGPVAFKEHMIIHDLLRTEASEEERHRTNDLLVGDFSSRYPGASAMPQVQVADGGHVSNHAWGGAHLGAVKDHSFGEYVPPRRRQIRYSRSRSRESNHNHDLVPFIPPLPSGTPTQKVRERRDIRIIDENRSSSRPSSPLGQVVDDETREPLEDTTSTLAGPNAEKRMRRLEILVLLIFAVALFKLYTTL